MKRKKKPNRRIHRRQLKVIIDGYKQRCVEAIANGDFEDAKYYKRKIEQAKRLLRRC